MVSRTKNKQAAPRLVNAKSGCVCRNRRYFRLFRYTLDRGIIEVNGGAEVRLDKPKTRNLTQIRGFLLAE